MQAAILPIQAGWQWIVDGWKLFLKQPSAMFFWSLMMAVLLMISTILFVFGQAILIAFTPLLTFLFLSAARQLNQGKRIGLDTWLAPLRANPELRKRLLKLGLAYLACCIAAGVVAVIPFIGEINHALAESDTIDSQALASLLRGPLISFGLLYLLILGLFLHAPALVGWHSIKVGQALFYSAIACWRNKWAFIIYGISWAAIFSALHLLENFFISLGISPAATQFLITPIHLATAAVLYSSFYFAYVTVFEQNES